MNRMIGDGQLSATFEELTAEDGAWHPPFRWQMRLLRRLLDADLPRFVDIPTGLGKTSAMALWLIALGEGAHLPRRLVYVVDRRAVVEQATQFAKRLRLNMPGELAEKLGLDAGARLPISTLRGGFADNRDWLEDPSKPAIVVGTIDMVGSRLLFEGYGVSRGMRPCRQVAAAGPRCRTMEGCQGVRPIRLAESPSLDITSDRTHHRHPPDGLPVPASVEIQRWNSRSTSSLPSWRIPPSADSRSLGSSSRWGQWRYHLATHLRAGGRRRERSPIRLVRTPHGR